MADLIYRQAAIDVLKRDEALVRAFGYQHAIESIQALPSAQPEIVRCGDCKYYNPIGVCIEMSSAVCEDSFCCWAERKENG